MVVSGISDTLPSLFVLRDGCSCNAIEFKQTASSWTVIHSFMKICHIYSIINKRQLLCPHGNPKGCSQEGGGLHSPFNPPPVTSTTTFNGTFTIQRGVRKAWEMMTTILVKLVNWQCSPGVM